MPPKNTSSWSQALAEFNRAKAVHLTINSALTEAATLWQKGAQDKIPEDQREGLPKTHPVYSMIDVNKLDQSVDLALQGNINYPALILIQVASAKFFASKLTEFWRLWGFMGSVDDDELKRRQKMSSAGGLYDTLNNDPDPFLDTREKVLWEDGFRAGLAYAKRATKPKPPDRRMQHPPQFWTTYQAWLLLQTDAAIKHEYRNLDKTNQLVAVLKRFGVTKTNDALLFPTGIMARTKPMKLSTFRDNLTGWRKDFRVLAQIPK